jgi:hypothetical protein
VHARWLVARNIHTITSNAHVKYIADLNIDNAKKALAFLFKLFLIEYLYCNNALVFRLTKECIFHDLD